MMARPGVIRELLKARLPFMVDRLAEAVALALLARPELLRERVGLIKDGCRMLTAALRELGGVEVVPSQANFVLFRATVEPAVLMHRLAEAGVLVRSMKGYPELRGFLRVNAGTTAENKAFLAALKSALQVPGDT
jgi:histidinol-phosphate aminotransferase